MDNINFCRSHNYQITLNNSHWPTDVGIKAIEFVVPKLYVAQTELEKYDKVSAGKYTQGLGQKEMGFCSDLEDINSLSLTAFDTLMMNNGLKYKDIGRVDVGTETIIDKSKSVKTVLMDLFKDSGNFNVEGLDTTNACYGGTAALFNALAWIESSAWDGRMAVVIAGDIAVYAEGSARPTGGAGAIAMLVGPDANIVIDRGLRATYMTNVYDFYKPDLTSEYPIVDGQLSIRCYLSALDICYNLYKRKTDKTNFDLNHFDAFVFHSPYCKLVQKSLARLLFNDYLNAVDKDTKFPGLEHLRGSTLENSYFDKNVEREFLQMSKEKFVKMTEPSLMLASRVGNMYTASVYGCLISYLANTPLEHLSGKRIGIFSYGSGLASSMYSVTLKDGTGLNELVLSAQRIKQKLDERVEVSPDQFSSILKKRAATLHTVPFTPQSSIDDLFPGTWYLQQIDDKHRRFYSKKSQ